MSPLRARVRRVRTALPRAVGNARAVWHARDGVLVVLTDADGCFGQGEASPLPGFSSDHADACERALVAAVGDPEAALAHPLLRRTPAARFALETAWLDLHARRRGCSLAEVFGAAPDASVGTAALIDGEPEGWPTQVAMRIEEGFRTVKCKVGRDADGFVRERAALRAIRLQAPAIDLRLDANGAWTVPEARERLAQLADDAQPTFVEEPVRGALLLDLGRCAVPWAADESLCDEGLRTRLLEAPDLGAVVLKPALLGGLDVATALALDAAARGLPAIVSHLFDGPIALAAACSLALALPVRVAHGLAPHAALDAWPRVAMASLREPGRLVADPSPGLGLPRLDELLDA